MFGLPPVSRPEEASMRTGEEMLCTGIGRVTPAVDRSCLCLCLCVWVALITSGWMDLLRWLSGTPHCDMFYDSTTGTRGLSLWDVLIG